MGVLKFHSCCSRCWISCLFKNKYCSAACADHILFLHSSANGYLDNAAQNTHTEISESLISVLLGLYPGTELLGHTVILIFLKNHQTVFHGDWTMLHSHGQHTSVLVSPRPHQQLVLTLSVFLRVAVITGVQCHLMVLCSTSEYQSNWLSVAEITESTLSSNPILSNK